MISLIKSKNKKADISITILVIMVLVLVGVALLIFFNSGKQQTTKIAITSPLSEFYKEQASFELYLKSIATELVDNYQKNNKDSIITPEIFIEQFKTNYGIYEGNVEFPKYFNSETLKKGILNNSNYAISITGDKFSFNLKNLEFFRNYDIDSSLDIRNIALSKAVSFEIINPELAIPLKTPNP